MKELNRCFDRELEWCFVLGVSSLQRHRPLATVNLRQNTTLFSGSLNDEDVLCTPYLRTKYEVLPTVFAVIDLTVIKANRAKRCPKYTVLPSIITRASYYGSVERFPEDGIVV